jgi:hypothetical protein
MGTGESKDVDPAISKKIKQTSFFCLDFLL